jgi:hypothetical protein
MSLAKTVKSLAEQVFSSESKDRETARMRYPVLLEMREAKEEQVRELREAMRLLGKGPDELQADLNTMAEYRMREAQFQAGRNLGDKHSAAVTAVGNHQAETQRIMAARGDQLASLVGEVNQLDAVRRQAEAAVKEMEKLRLREPDLFVNETAIALTDER